MLRIAALLIVIGGSLAAGPAAAQFGNIFGDSPPRPPADIPNGGEPSSSDYPGQAPPSYPAYPAPGPGAYPGQPAPAYPAAPRPPSAAVEEQALPPPPGAPAPGQAYPAQPADRGYPPPPLQGQAPAKGALAPPPQGNSQAAPAAGEAAPDEETVVEKPTAHIANKRAVFVGLDKITGRTIKFDAALGETVQFGALQVTPRTCYTRPPTEATNTDAFVEVDEVTLKGDIKRIFTGWMFALSPGLNAVEHPIYDVWLIDCASPIETTLAQPAEQSAASPPSTRHPPVRRRSPPARDEVEPQPD
jgi:hypothetical protein